MNEKMMKLLSKKKDGAKGMSDAEKGAKMSVVKDMQDMAKKAMSGKMDGLKKVTVASDSKPGLMEGIDKAKELIGQGDYHGLDESHDKPDMEEESPEEESSESSSDELSEMEQDLDHLDEAELDKLAKMIEMKKAQKQHGGM